MRGQASLKVRKKKRSVYDKVKEWTDRDHYDEMKTSHPHSTKTKNSAYSSLVEFYSELRRNGPT